MDALLVILLGLLILGLLVWLKPWQRLGWRQPEEPFPPAWRSILAEWVHFYRKLSPEEQKRFEYEVQEFLLNYTISGVAVEVDETDRLLVAASAIIPIFAFPEWHYRNLREVLLYPDNFNDDFATEGADRRIQGMVGTGYMQGQMALSKPALRRGFSNVTDKHNTAIHEFIHLIDKADGAVDGVPEALLDKPYVIPWLNLMHKEMEAILSGDSDIRPYGATSPTEFFAVAGEYFFERPVLLARKHPELYRLLAKVFGTIAEGE